MYKIQANASGTRSIEVTEEHLITIDQYQLFRDLIDSTGYVDEQVLEKLKLNIRSLLEASYPEPIVEQQANAQDNSLSDEQQQANKKCLLDLCLDVIYNQNMKAFGLQQLVVLFINWKAKKNTGTEPESNE